MGWFSSHAEDHAERVQNEHDRGQTDASNGTHNDGSLGHLLDPLMSTQEATELESAYEQGHAHTTSQK